jgi:ethanolamine utilization protein EutN
MQVARVVGRATATVKHYSLDRLKLLIVKPLMADGVRIDGEPIITIDLIGAGVGDDVILSSDGASVRQALNIEHNPIRWSVVGIVDPSANRS